MNSLIDVRGHSWVDFSLAGFTQTPFVDTMYPKKFSSVTDGSLANSFTYLSRPSTRRKDSPVLILRFPIHRNIIHKHDNKVLKNLPLSSWSIRSWMLGIGWQLLMSNHWRLYSSSALEFEPSFLCGKNKCRAKGWERFRTSSRWRKLVCTVYFPWCCNTPCTGIMPDKGGRSGLCKCRPFPA